MLMSALAKAKGLPETCYGVMLYTGECIRIRFGADRYESLPQFSNKALENRGYANEQNEASGITPTQVAAMENGVIYGWDTPYPPLIRSRAYGDHSLRARKRTYQHKQQ